MPSARRGTLTIVPGCQQVDTYVQSGCSEVIIPASMTATESFWEFEKCARITVADGDIDPDRGMKKGAN